MAESEGVPKEEKEKRGLLKKLLLLTMSVSICLLIGEFTAYSLYKDKPLIYPRFTTEATYGDFKIRRQVPNAHYYHKSLDGVWEFDINSKGLRNYKEFEYAKPEGTIRMLTIGDSYTLGFEVRQDQTYSAVLEKYLNRKGLNCEVINCGVGGFSNAEELVFLENEGIKYNPDVIILGFYVNDLVDNIRADLYRLADGKLVLNKKVYLPGIKTRDFLNSFFIYRWLSQHSYLHNLLRTLASRSFSKKLLKKHLGELRRSQESKPEDIESSGEQLAVAIVKRMYSIAKQHNIHFILLDIPSSRYSTEEPKPSFPVLADSEYSDVCDSYFNSLDVLKDYEGLVDLYQPHGMHHATEFTHALIGKSLGDELLEKFSGVGEDEN